MIAPLIFLRLGGKSMEKFEKVFFNILTKEMNFFMRDYYSSYNEKNKWIGLLDIEDTYVAVLIVKDSEEQIIFNEVKEYLSNNLNKPFIINLIVLASGEYLSYGENFYNKLVFSLKERNVIYCSEGSKAFLPVIDYIVKMDGKKTRNFNEYNYTYSIILIIIVIFFFYVCNSFNM